MKTEFEVGEVFQCGLIKLKCVEGIGCTGCVFIELQEFDCNEITGSCSSKREDGTNVIFVKAED